MLSKKGARVRNLERLFLCPGTDGIPQGARKAVRLCPGMDGLKIAPCIFRTSHIRVGRISQGARKAVRLCPWMDGMPQKARDGGAVISMDGRA